MRLVVQKAGRALGGEITPPGDKSISHRALIFTGLAAGVSRIDGLLQSGDTHATRTAMEQLGAHFEADGTSLVATGIGAQGLRAPRHILDMGNSGTAMRLLSGVLAGQGFDSTLSGDISLNSRPMGRIIKPLEMMGARIEAQEAGRAPLIIHGCDALRGIDYESPVASAQIKSCVLLAGLYANGVTRVREPGLSRDHTERMLPHFGITMEPGSAPAVRGGQLLQAADVVVPADPSSAAFLAAAALLVPGSDVLLRGVGLNPTRDGFFRVLGAMGAQLDYLDRRDCGGEPVADIRVRYCKGLRGIDVPAAWIPSMIDEVPILLALASQAQGTTRIREAEELRVKESDRLAVMARGLASMGVAVQEYPDGIDIVGGPANRAVVDAHHDHRCAMSFAVLGLCSDGGSEVTGAEYIDTSYPEFRSHLETVGAALRTSES